jgi:hypothetical protein
MENAPVIGMTFRSPIPGADPEIWDRYVKWGEEVYSPLTMKIPMVRALEHYVSLKQSPQYPLFGSISHYENFRAAEDARTTTERKAIEGEIASWAKREIVDYFWRVRYQHLKTFGSGKTSILTKDVTAQNAPIIHMEAYSFPKEQEEKYGTWLNDFGFSLFIPLFTRIPGLLKYEFYRCLDAHGVAETREYNYPMYLSIIHLENQKAFESFEKSPENVVTLNAIRKVFTKMPLYHWYVQYQLVKSWRK